MKNRATVARELASPFQTVRLLCLEDLLENGCDPETMTLVVDHEQKEPDSICRMLITSIRTGPGSRPGGPTPPVSEKAFADAYFAGTVEERRTLVSGLTAESLRKHSGQIGAILEQERNPHLLFVILRTFGRVWPTDQAEPLFALLRSDQFSLQLASLGILTRICPERLASHLPPLLTSPEPHIRALAVWGLTKIDLEEALKHLAILLEQPSADAKHAGLQNCFLFPFDRVKPLLLTFIAEENDPQLLEEALLLIASNPAPDVPPNLVDMLEGAPPQKESLIRQMIQASCQALKKSGALGESFGTYMERLQNWVREKNTARFWHRCRMRLQSGDPALIDETVNLLGERMSQPAVRDRCLAALSEDLPDAAKNRLRSLLASPAATGTIAGGPVAGDPIPDGPDSSPPPSVPVPTCSPETLPRPKNQESPPAPDAMGPDLKHRDFSDLTTPDRIRLLSSWPADRSRDAQPLLDRMIKDPQTGVGLLAVCFRTARRLSIQGYLAHAEKACQSSEPNLATAGLEYLVAFDLDRGTLQLGKFLQAQNPWMKASALDILQKCDPRQAVSAIRALLSEKNPAQAEMALAAMMNFSFPAVRTVLVEFLLRNPEERHVDAGLVLFQMNPDPENLFPLFKLEKVFHQPWSVKAREIRSETSRFLLDSGLFPTLSGLPSDADLEKLWQAEQEKKAARPPGYSVQSLHPSAARAGIPWQDILGQLKSFLGEHILQVGIFVSLALGINLWLSLPSETPSQPLGGGPVEAISRTVLGSIQSMSAEEIAFEGNDGTRYTLLLNSGQFRKLPPGTKLIVKLTPFRKTQEGVVVAQIDQIAQF